MSSLTGVARYLAKKTEHVSVGTATTGVEKYLARQAGLNQSSTKVLTGVEKYLRNIG